MKVGILTLQSFNYGNRLQNYALQQALLNMGHDVQSIRRVPNGYRESARNTVRDIVKRDSYAKFRFFNHHYIRYSKVVVSREYTTPDFESCFDKFVIGSDQVWNPNFPMVSELDWLPSVSSDRKVAYAASFGVASLGDYQESVSHLLRGFKWVSMREEAGAIIVAVLSGLTPPVVLDPTLLLDADTWSRFAQRPKGLGCDSPYVLRYCLGNGTDDVLSNDLARERGLALLDLSTNMDLVGPREFIWLIQHADAVCTDSFHGSVFSLIFHRPLVIAERSDANADMSSRLDTLCRSFGMEDCRTSSKSFDPSLIYGREWCSFEERISELRESSTRWLKRALEGRSPLWTSGGIHESAVVPSKPPISVVGERCCGCGACAAACPASCLSMESDACGFVRPAYVRGCIGCGRCAKVCPVLNPGTREEAIKVFWAKAKNDALRESSSSGAVFGLLAEKVLTSGGVVYGAAFSGGCKAVRHVRVDDPSGLDTVMRSKYVQSSVDIEVYEGVERDLGDGRRVLFSGTACQLAAMRNYLTLRKVPTDSLLLVEVVCHGVPSPRLWSEWVDHISGTSNGEIAGVNFRDKSTGWVSYSVRYEIDNGSARFVGHGDDWYMKAFLQNASLRRSCLNCPAKRRCGSDITLGDFWGLQNFYPEVMDNLGVSAVICNTEIGQAALLSISASADIGASTFEKVEAGNPSIAKSSEAYSERDAFLADVARGMPVERLTKKWTFEPSLKQKVFRFLSKAETLLIGSNK